MTRALAVIDTNVVVARSYLFPLPNPRCDADWRSYWLSTDLLAEYRAVLLRPKIGSLHGLRERDVDLLLTELATNAIFREPELVVGSQILGDARVWSPVNQALIEGPLSRVAILTPGNSWSVIRSDVAGVTSSRNLSRN